MSRCPKLKLKAIFMIFGIKNNVKQANLKSKTKKCPIGLNKCL